jgi:hypothetical protein
MTSPHQEHLNQENVHARESVVERLQSRWSSSSRVIVDTPPSQPPSLEQMSGSPSSGSEKESHHEDPGAGGFQRGSAFERPQRSNSKWTSGSEVITDSPPLQPLSRRGGSPVGILQQSGSRWSSGSQAACDTASSQALSVSALKHSAAMKNHDDDIFETKIRARCILNLSRTHLSPRCITSRSA